MFNPCLCKLINNKLTYACRHIKSGRQHRQTFSQSQTRWYLLQSNNALIGCLHIIAVQHFRGNTFMLTGWSFSVTLVWQLNLVTYYWWSGINLHRHVISFIEWQMYLYISVFTRRKYMELNKSWHSLPDISISYLSGDFFWRVIQFFLYQRVSWRLSTTCVEVDGFSTMSNFTAHLCLVCNGN